MSKARHAITWQDAYTRKGYKRWRTVWRLLSAAWCVIWGRSQKENAP